MITAAEIKRWLDTLPDDDTPVAVDEGGLCLIVLAKETLVPTGPYLEVGGAPNTCLDCGRAATDFETWESVCPQCQRENA